MTVRLIGCPCNIFEMVIPILIGLAKQHLIIIRVGTSYDILRPEVSLISEKREKIIISRAM